MLSAKGSTKQIGNDVLLAVPILVYSVWEMGYAHVWYLHSTINSTRVSGPSQPALELAIKEEGRRYDEKTGVRFKMAVSHGPLRMNLHLYRCV